MNSQYYCAHRSYEHLIGRSLMRPVTNRDTKRVSAYLRFINTRDGFKFRNENLKKQFETLKNYLFDALTKFLKRRLMATEKVAIRDLINELQSANKVEQIDLIVQKGLVITNRLK